MTLGGPRCPVRLPDPAMPQRCFVFSPAQYETPGELFHLEVWRKKRRVTGPLASAALQTDLARETCESRFDIYPQSGRLDLILP